jgi:hypothetical protein
MPQSDTTLKSGANIEVKSGNHKEMIRGLIKALLLVEQSIERVEKSIKAAGYSF